MIKLAVAEAIPEERATTVSSDVLGNYNETPSWCSQCAQQLVPVWIDLKAFVCSTEVSSCMLYRPVKPGKLSRLPDSYEPRSFGKEMPS